MIVAEVALSTNLLQKFCKFMLHSGVIIKSVTGPDDTCQVHHRSPGMNRLKSILTLSYRGGY